MNTEQAHSLPVGRGAVRSWPGPGTAARAGATVWLNLVCLDAPIVAVVWLFLFARTFDLPVHSGNAVALFLTAWWIYLADRLADATSLKAGTPQSLRQRFCLRHREVWIAGLLLIAGFDLYVIWRSVAAETLIGGAIVGILALIYLALNYPRGLIWRSWPAKEAVIGLLFTAGTLVPLFPAARAASAAFITCGLAFACLCSMNCISIAGWERELDRAQGKVSVATRHPGCAGHAASICIVLALVAFAFTVSYPAATPVLVCVGTSAFLLALLNTLSPRFGDDQRSALADLVLLTPIIPLMLAL